MGQWHIMSHINLHKVASRYEPETMIHFHASHTRSLLAYSSPFFASLLYISFFLFFPSLRSATNREKGLIVLSWRACWIEMCFHRVTARSVVHSWQDSASEYPFVLDFGTFVSSVEVQCPRIRGRFEPSSIKGRTAAIEDCSKELTVLKG